MDPHLDTLPPQEPSSFKKLIANLASLSHSRILSVLFLLLVVAAVPLTVYVSQQQQETRQRAEEKIVDQGKCLPGDAHPDKYPTRCKTDFNECIAGVCENEILKGSWCGDRDETNLSGVKCNSGKGTCKEGVCKDDPLPFECSLSNLSSCNDDNDCTSDACQQASDGTKKCTHPPIKEGQVCYSEDSGSIDGFGICKSGKCLAQPPPGSNACGKECKYSQADPNGSPAKCYLGNCADGSQNCGTAVNTNCRYVEGCSKGTVVSCSTSVPNPPSGGNSGTGSPGGSAVANKGKCEGKIEDVCGNPNKLSVSWTVEGKDGECNVFLRAGEDEQIDTKCRGTKTVERFKGSDPNNKEGNPINKGEVYQLFVSNGGNCLNKYASNVTVSCTANGQEGTTTGCRDLLPSQTNPPSNLDDTKFKWIADCQKTCQQNTECPKNTTQTGVTAETSNWCYSFEDGKKCIKLEANKTTPSGPTRAPTPVPTGFAQNNFNNTLAKRCTDPTDCVNGKLSCTENRCTFISDVGTITTTCDRSKLATDCKIFPRNVTFAPRPAPLPEESWWCKLMKNTPFKCNASGVSEKKQQVPEKKDGIGVGWFNPFGWLDSPTPTSAPSN